MNITIEKSLITSWLKHVKKCQITQLDWTASPFTWDLHSETEINNIMETTGSFFFDNYDLDIYKNFSSKMHLLQSSKIDVLGLKMDSENISDIFCVTIMDQVNGWNYDNGTSIIENIISTIICSVLHIHSCFNISKGRIVFAAPKIHKSLSEKLLLSVKSLNELFTSSGYHFKFQLLINEDFTEEILKPLLYESTISTDKSELFLQGLQLYNLALIEQGLSSGNANDENSDSSTKIGKFVRNEFEILINKKVLTDDIIENLLDSGFSKETFGLRFPMLKRFNEHQSISDQRLIKGNGRYYSQIFIINNNKYLLCNDWYEKNRSSLMKWLKSF